MRFRDSPRALINLETVRDFRGLLRLSDNGWQGTWKGVYIIIEVLTLLAG